MQHFRCRRKNRNFFRLKKGVKHVLHAGENMKSPKELLNIVSESDIPVLLLGESGVGKEVAARYIHSHSNRNNSPFVALNCGAIAKNLIESILEGSAKGSFTGATNEQKGIVRAAEGGTLFLDEIGELPLESQSKLLRILQEKAVLPIGTTKSICVNFRLICATNKDLKEEILAGRFREDLFFRINVFPIQMPALRDRTDFSELTQELWLEICSSLNAPYQQLSSFDILQLQKKTWPGNIRQLKNVLQRYAVLKQHQVTLCEILSEEFSKPCICEKNIFPFYELGLRKKYSRAPNISIIESSLKECNGNKSQAAQKLGISRGSLCYQLQKQCSINQMAG